MPGRPRKLTELKKLEGTYRKDRDISKNVPKFTRLVSTCEAPIWFNDSQKKEFEFITSELIRLNILENVDMNAIFAYCIESSKYFKLIQKIENNPNEATNQDEINAARHLKAMMDLGKEFGFTPNARQKLLIQNKEKPEDDPAAKYLNI